MVDPEAEHQKGKVGFASAGDTQRGEGTTVRYFG